MSNPIFNTQAFPSEMSEKGRERRRFYMNNQGTVTEEPRQQQYPAQGPSYAQQYGMPGQTQVQQGYGQAQPGFGGGQPPAGGQERGYGGGGQFGGQGAAPMTYDEVINKTITSFLVLLLGAGLAVSVGFFNPVALGAVTLVGVLGGLVLGLVNAFKKEPNPGLILTYSLFQGLFVGGITYFLEGMFPGIATQAVVATLIVFCSVLVLFKSGKVRATPKLNKMFFVALMAYAVFCLLNLGLMLFGGTSSMFGLRTEFSPWIGLAIGALAILLATYSLVLDFTLIQEGVEAGVAKQYAWAAAFGLTVSVVWLYIEILRIIAIIRSMAD